MNSIFHSIRILLNGIEKFHDTITARHEHSTGKMMSLLANAMNMSTSDCNALEEVGGLHDIGKLAIPATILEKPGPLTVFERKMIELHPKVGVELISNLKHPLTELAQVVILNHHESFDGSGYPNGLKGTKIPREAQICSICDVYDALRSHRHYRDSHDNHVEAIKKITSNGDGGMADKFDPLIVRAFVDIHQDINDAFLER